MSTGYQNSDPRTDLLTGMFGKNQVAYPSGVYAIKANGGGTSALSVDYMSDPGIGKPVAERLPNYLNYFPNKYKAVASS